MKQATRRGQRLAHLVEDADIRHGVTHQAADEEFEREIVDALCAGRIGAARRIHPLVGDAVAGDENRGGQPVMRLGHFRVLADAVLEAFQKFRRELFAIRRPGGGCEVVGGYPVHHRCAVPLALPAFIPRKPRLNQFMHLSEALAICLFKKGRMHFRHG